MAAPTIDHQKSSFRFYDGDQNESTVSHYVPLGTAYVDMDPLFTTMTACSNLALETASFSYEGSDPSINATAGVYASVEEAAVLTFEAADGSAVNVSIPGPKASLFQADGKTINPAAGAVAAVIVEILAILVTKGGAILVEYVKGYKKGRKARKTKPGVVFNPTA